MVGAPHIIQGIIYVPDQGFYQMASEDANNLKSEGNMLRNYETISDNPTSPTVVA